MKGKEVRLGRFLGGNRNVAVVALDHGAEFGPIEGLMNLRAALDNLDAADGILLNPGALGKCGGFFARPGAPALIARLTWTTAYCFPWDYQEAHTCRLLTADEALAAGADLVMACCLVQSGDESVDRDNVRLFADIAAEAEAAGVPLIGELYPLRAEQLPEAELHEQVYRGARILAELGADAIKTFYTGKRFAEVVEGAGVPIFVLGASKKAKELDALRMAHEAVQAGARGVVFGRNVFQAADPARFLAALGRVVHKEATPEEAMT